MGFDTLALAVMAPMSDTNMDGPTIGQAMVLYAFGYDGPWPESKYRAKGLIVQLRAERKASHSER